MPVQFGFRQYGSFRGFFAGLLYLLYFVWFIITFSFLIYEKLIIAGKLSRLCNPGGAMIFSV